EFNIMPFGLLPAQLHKIGAVHAIREPEIIFNFRFPFRHRVTGIDHQSVALGTSEIDCSRKSCDAAADNDHLSYTPVTQVSWFDPFAHTRLFVAARGFDRVRSGSIVRV